MRRGRDARVGSVDRPLLRDGPRLALGAHAARLRPARPRPRRAPRGDAAPRRSAPPTSAARPTSSSSRRWSARRRASARATASSASTSGPTACARSPARWPSRASTSSTAAARRRCARYATMAEYEEGWPYPVAFPPAAARGHAGRGARRAREPQLHVAETEKYAHVTYFFNGGEEAPVRGRGRELVPSPRDVPTYDHKPRDERRARPPTRSRSAWREDGPRFGIINFANPDMVGHTGRDPRRRRGRRDRRRVPRPRSSRAVQESGGALLDHRRPRQRRPHARARRLARTPPTRSTPCR